MDFPREHHPLWQNTDVPFLPSLSSHETADVCVIGAGITGLSVAYALLEAGLNVVVIERDGLFRGETTRSSAHLTAALDHRYFRLRREHGAEKAALAAASHAFAIGEIERIAAVESIDCGFTRVPGYLFLAPGDDEDVLHRELEACREAGVPGVELLTAARSPLLPCGPCLRFPLQARFHPGRYLAGLARAIQRRGGRVYAHTESTRVEPGSPSRVTTNRGFQVVCETIALATNAPLRGTVLLTKMAPYRTYLIALGLPAARNDLSLFWDTAEPYHYLRTAEDAAGPLLLVGGEDHRTGQDLDGGDRFQHLRAWARDRVGLEGELRWQWSGQVLEPHDGLAFLGVNPGDSRVLVATGASGNGLTYGAIAGRVLADVATGRENPWRELYDPSRVNVRSLFTFARENAKSAAPYSDWLTEGDVSSVDEIPRGEGAVLRDGMQKVAVYRDERGRPHFFSATCPHMRGIVRWNSAEKTWDCPCHGSRFGCLGHVLSGPAPVGLRAIADTLSSDTEAASA